MTSVSLRNLIIRTGDLRARWRRATALSGDREPPPFPPRLIAVGGLAVGFFVAFFLAWSALAPLEGAVVSRGIVSVESHRKQIEHLEGGIVEAIHVRDGDRVARGQVLVQLSDVQPAAELRLLDMQSLEARAVEARLLAELDEAAAIAFADDLLARAQDPAVASIISGQENILASRRALVQDQRSVVAHKIAQAEKEIEGLRGRVRAKQRQQTLMLEELATLDAAFAKQLVAKSRLLQLRQRLAGLEGELSDANAEIARLQQGILELGLQQSEARARRVTDITTQLRTKRAQLFDLGQNILAARDVLQRTKIVAPIDGVVVNLQIHTRGGVIAAGQPLLEVVPSHDDLIVYAFVHPDDVDEVAAGMAADVRLTSLSRRSHRPLAGKVTGLSADRLTDPASGQDYFRARIELFAEAADAERPHLIAGMGAEVFIRTGARTPLDYLLAPITRSMQHGLREY